MTRCLRDTLSWGTLIALGGSVWGVVLAIRNLITQYGTWAAVIEAIGIAGVLKALALVVGAIAAIVVLAAVLGCLVHCRRYW